MDRPKDRRTELVEEHKGFAVYMAVEACRRWRVVDPTARDDLFQAAYLGMVDAADRYDPDEHAAAFAAYARPSIRRALAVQHYGQRGPITLRRHAVEAWLGFRARRRRLCAELGRTPTDAEVAASLGWADGAMEAALAVAACVGAAPRRVHANLARRPICEPTGVAAREAAYLLRSLPPLRRKSVKLMFGLDGLPAMTRREAAASLKIPQTTFDSRYQDAMAALRAYAARRGPRYIDKPRSNTP